MRGSLLKNHRDLLKKSKAACPAKAASFRRTLNERNYSPLYIQKINTELDRLLAESTKNGNKKSSNNTSTSSSAGATVGRGSTSSSIKSLASTRSASTHSSKNSSLSTLASRSHATNKGSTSVKSLASSAASSKSDFKRSTATAKDVSSASSVVSRQASVSSTKSLASISTAQSSVNSSLKPLVSPTASSQVGSDVSANASSTVSQQWHSILNTRSNGESKRTNASKHISWEDQSTSTGMSISLADTETVSSSFDASTARSTATSSTTARSTSKRSNPTKEANNKRLILDLSELKISTFNKPFNDKEIKQLFVEMCFYARLGFVQPPCCLNCAYGEIVRDDGAVPDCTRWTVWRKDTNLLLHPSHLEHNTVIVQCHAAQKLLGGETLEGYGWNAEEEVLETRNGNAEATTQ